MKRRTRGIFLIALGLIMTISAAGIFGVYEYQAEIAGDNAELLLETLQEEMRHQKQTAIYDPAQEEIPTAELPRMTLNGYDLVGILSVPVLGLELPVMDTWNYDLLQLSPCRYSGSAAEGDLILLGHNYKRHFAPLKGLTAGARIEFSDVRGQVYVYEVAETEVLEKTELERLTGTDYDLTLFTCTNGGYSRFVVRCRLLEVQADTSDPQTGLTQPA